MRSKLQSFRESIERLSGVTMAPHRFGGVEFQVHGLEFMHFHGDTYLDARLSKEDQSMQSKQSIISLLQKPAG